MYDKIEKQILTRTAQAGKTHGFNDDHNPHEPSQWWFQQSTEGLVLFIVFYTQACRHGLCLGCNLPAMVSQKHVSFDCIMDQVSYIFRLDEVHEKKNDIRKVIVSNNGSVLDQKTFSSTALMYLIAKMNKHLPNLSVVAMETRPEYVEWEELTFINRALKEGKTPTALEFAVGFEAYDDHIRNKVFRKALELEQFEAFVRMVGKHNREKGSEYRIKCYFMQKPVPHMSDREALQDIMHAMDYLHGIFEGTGVLINMHLNPTYAAKGTPLETAFLEGNFTPPRLIDVATAAAYAEDKLISLFLGLFDEGGACKNGSFATPDDKPIIKRLELFNRTQEFEHVHWVISQLRP